MTTADRTVHHLRLRAPNAHAARQAVHRLEDALRCASLPDAGERVLLVRRLHLGPLPQGLSSQSLSLLIEQRVAAVGGAWVHGDDDARAARSDAVFFPNRLHAATSALRRRALGERLDAWHWPLALPDVDVHAEPTEFLSQLLHSVQQWPEAPVAMAALADHGQPEVRDWWAAHAPAEWRDHPGARVPRARARQPTPHDAVAQAPAGPRAAITHRGADTPAAVDASAGPRPDAHEAPLPWASTVQTPPHADPLSAGLAGDRDGPLNSPARGVERQGVAHAGERDTVHTRQTPAPPPPPEPAFAMAAARAQAAGAAIAAAHAPVPMDAFARHAVPDTSEDGVLLETRAGGLLFLWPLLQRVGFAEWDAAHPDAWMAPQVLRVALQRLRVPPDDPAWALLDSLPAAPEPGAEPDGAAWLRRCRRCARRMWQIGLASLVVRPAWLHWSDTHIDVHFRPPDADLRVRRAGLDTDPGWVDALQRVVGFHFDREDL
ncbi:hypothetical protein [Hydrogenophaga sp. 2FB]|uniref:hypothetical protein n=1 Tax=Hydrogenophaga sp. 2FB TaxID=2502187 RepID=UPI0010F4D2E3|nr:hypothetical protein [Hydrogenophaga sp. 2FB]